MSNYISEKMALVGCGAGDIPEIRDTCNGMTKDERNILDCWHNNGLEIALLPEFKETAENLKKQHSTDDLICLCAYVSARRNLEEY